MLIKPQTNTHTFFSKLFQKKIETCGDKDTVQNIVSRDKGANKSQQLQIWNNQHLFLIPKKVILSI